MNSANAGPKGERDEIPLYSTRISKNYYEYMGKYHPDIDMGPILDDAGIATHQLEDEGHWLTQSQVDRFRGGVVRISRERRGSTRLFPRLPEPYRSTPWDL